MDEQASTAGPAPQTPDGAPDTIEARLRAAAERALAEAEARRGATNAAKPGATNAAAPEIGGRDGPEPVRFGDWENKGRASDF
jgi:hypothetical protein